MSTMTYVTSRIPSSASPAEVWTRFKGFFRFRRSSVDQASFHMLSLYRANLDVRLRTVDEAALQTDCQKKIYATLTEMLKSPAAEGAADNLEWDEIYKAESLIVLLFSGAMLRQEISGRLQDLAVEEPAEAEARKRDYDVLLKTSAEGTNPGVDDAVLRAFLLRLLETLHWSAKKKYLARPIRIEATNRILVGLLLSFAALVAPYVYLVWDYGRGSDNLPVGSVWTLFALWTALTAGLLGAFCSRLMSIQSQWSKLTLDEVFLHREWPYTLLRAGVGVCGALIVYFFLRSGIAEGALFPKFADVKIQLIQVPNVEAVAMSFAMPSAALALLTFWCFLAGFSEALVPNILGSADRQFIDATTPSRK